MRIQLTKASKVLSIVLGVQSMAVAIAIDFSVVIGITKIGSSQLSALLQGISLLRH